MFGWREVYMSSSMTDCAKIREALDAKGVHYRYKTSSMNNDIRSRMSVIDTKFAVQYYIFVKKQDYELAQSITGNRPIR